MKKKWVIKEVSEPIVNMPEYPSLITRLLALRGIKQEDIGFFLNPDYSKLHDPFLFKDMTKAVDRIYKAIADQEKIVIYADYDADAITACAVMYQALKKLGGIVEYYIPDRFTEGYGMNQDAIKKIKADGAALIITVDCGINAVDEADLCRLLGLDLIITDHHELTGMLPQALAIINPKNPEDQYPFTYLTGVGVAFKLTQALFSKSQDSGWEKWFLDLVAIGTVADLQNLTSENRILVKFGLTVLSKTRWIGLKALLDSASLRDSNFDTYTLGFIIAPRINAAGRLKHADIAFRLLISENIVEAQNLALELNDLNAHRQLLTEQILSEAKAQVERDADKKILIAYGNDWPKGVVGLVAGKLTEQYNRPSLALSSGSDGFATGSARSVADFDMVQALGFAKDLLSRYGGHTQAAGFTLPVSNIEAFHKKLLEYAQLNNYSGSEASVKIDAELDPTDISWENYEYLEKLAPFGIGNPRPKFMSREMEIVDCRLVGAKSQHLKMRLSFGTHILEAVAFGQGFLASQAIPGKKIDAVYELTCNEWNGNRELQLKLIDVDFNE